MLSTLLNSFVSYFSKYFIVSSFLPVLAFAFFNGATALALVESFRDWFTDTAFVNATAVRTVFLTSTAVVALLAAAYVLSSLNNYLRGLLEGKWPEWLRRLSVGGQVWRLQELQRRISFASRVFVDLDRDGREWLTKLAKASRASVAEAAQYVTTAEAVASVRAKVDKMHRKQLGAELIDSKDILSAVTELEGALGASRATPLAPAHQRAIECHEAMVLIIQSTAEQAKNEVLRWHNQLSSSFGPQQVAPTSMGNIANTAQAYAVRRYDCNFELFLSNLQRVVQKDANAHTALQESKAQLDFLVSCCWLTTAYWVIWLVVFGVWGWSVALFCGLALLGPFGSYVWYRVATEHYRSFVDVLTTTLDLFRLELLRALSMPLPTDVIDERILWDNLHRLASFEGDIVNLKYQPSKGGTPT